MNRCKRDFSNEESAYDFAKSPTTTLMMVWMSDRSSRLPMEGATRFVCGSFSIMHDFVHVDL